jgi:multiple sugar transport system substrate-binding protein
MTDSPGGQRQNVKRRRFLKTAGATGVLGLLAGCGGGDTTTGDGDGAEPTETATETTTPTQTPTDTKTAESFTREYVDVDGDRAKEHFMPIIEELNGKYDADISLNFREIPYGNLKKQLLTRVGADDAPDVAAIDQIWLGSFYESGKLMAFNDMEEQLNFSNYFAGFQEAVRQEGNIVGFPITTDVRGMYWNKDLYEQAGLDPNKRPETWSEFYQMAEQVHNPPQTFGTGIIVAAGIYSVPLFASGGQFLTSGGSEPAFQKQPGVEAAAVFDKIHNEKGIGPNNPVTKGSSFPQEFLKGTYATTPVYGSWMDYFARQQGMSNDEIKQKFGFGLTPHPEGKEPATMMGGFAWAAFNTTERPDIVRDFMAHISTKEFGKKISIETGRIPTRKPLLEESEVWSDIMYADTIKGMLEYGGTRPVNNWSPTSSTLTPALQRIAFDKAEPEQALQSAADELRSKL